MNVNWIWIGFKTELKLNNKQRTIMAKHAGVARHAYNWGLAICKEILNYNQANTEAKIKFPSAADCGFYEFRRQLEYKCDWYGSILHIVDRFYPSSKTCSNCGEIKKDLKLKERTFNCSHCGLSIDRDLNACINLCNAVSSTV